MSVTPALARDYVASNYWIMLPNAILFLRPGVADTSLYDLHSKENVYTSAIVLPCNPASHRLSAAENRKLLASFARIISMSWKFYACAGAPLSGRERMENSFFILGIDRQSAVSLGRKHGQHAIIYYDIKRTNPAPELVACNARDQKAFNDALALKQRATMP